MGTQLLKMFKDLLGEEKVYNLCDEQNFGPKKALEDYKNVDNLRIIGTCNFSHFSNIEI